jgi:hypothetical protein
MVRVSVHVQDSAPLDILDVGTVLDGRHRLQAAQEFGLKNVPTRTAALNGQTPSVCHVERFNTPPLLDMLPLMVKAVTLKQFGQGGP